MSYILTFLAGAVIGGVAVWLYRSQITASLTKAAKESITPKE